MGRSACDYNGYGKTLLIKSDLKPSVLRQYGINASVARITTVCAWLGHSSPAVTLSTYSHIFPSKKNEIVNYFNKLDISIFKGRG